MRRRLLLTCSALMAAAGISLLGNQAYLRAKGLLAGLLIDRACAAYMQDGLPHRPWRWADMHLVARLEVPRLGVRRTVLSGATGSTLAFGLGHLEETAIPGQPGNCVLAGHRDTCGAFLEDLRVGDEVRLRGPQGTWSYRVKSTMIVTNEETRLLEPTDEPRLTLVTCYPFSGLLRSRWRYAVICAPDLALHGPFQPAARAASN